MNRPRQKEASLRDAISDFFFDEQVPVGAALTRVFLPLMALLPMLMRFPRVRELYSSDGTPVQMFELFGNGQVLPVPGPGLAVMLYSLMVFCLMCGVVGWKTRLSLAVGTALYVYFNLMDGIGTMTKYSVIAGHLLMLLTLSPCGRMWSVDEWLRQRKNGAVPVVPQAFPVWSVRLMQLLFAYVYFGAAITKIQTDAFFSGEQMRYWMLSNWNYENPVGELLAMWPPVLLVSAYLTVVWEILFGVLVWNRRLRVPMLAIGAVFHLGTWLLLGLYIFPAVCLSGYLCFVTTEDVVRVRRWLKSRGWQVTRLRNTALRTQMPSAVPSGIAWFIAAGLFAVGTVEAEYRLDLYGVRGESGMMPLTEIQRERAIALISGETPLREKDKFFSFQIGNTSFGGQLANRREVFEYGDVVIAECNLNPPHEDMWVECVLEDEDEHKLDTVGQVITREMLRGQFTYLLGNRLSPGRYSMVLRSAGHEISRRGFSLTGEPPVCKMDTDVFGN
ncbi:MAG: HTTM domain-containing protein [Fuerstiella sp.]|nr:HTTM domain-containing protein [Fuerstiella sp.]